MKTEVTYRCEKCDLALFQYRIPRGAIVTLQVDEGFDPIALHLLRCKGPITITQQEVTVSAPTPTPTLSAWDEYWNDRPMGGFSEIDEEAFYEDRPMGGFKDW